MPRPQDARPLACPDSLPPAMWNAFQGAYNPQQLRAIAAVCDTSPSPSSADLVDPPKISLLQGPPGTGKTRTILAVVGALLAGGGTVQVTPPSKPLSRPLSKPLSRPLSKPPARNATCR